MVRRKEHNTYENRKEQLSIGPFSLETLDTYKGDPFLNIHFLVAYFLYDYPAIAGNPIELARAIDRLRKGKGTSADKRRISILIRRIMDSKNAKHILKYLPNIPVKQPRRKVNVEETTLGGLPIWP